MTTTYSIIEERWSDDDLEIGETDDKTVIENDTPWEPGTLRSLCRDYGPMYAQSRYVFVSTRSEPGNVSEFETGIVPIYYLLVGHITRSSVDRIKRALAR